MSESKKDKSSKVKEQNETYDVTERYEIIDGIRYDMKPSPKLNHQILVTQLWQSIDRTFEPAI